MENLFSSPAAKPHVSNPRWWAGYANLPLSSALHLALAKTSGFTKVQARPCSTPRQGYPTMHRGHQGPIIALTGVSVGLITLETSRARSFSLDKKCLQRSDEYVQVVQMFCNSKRRGHGPFLLIRNAFKDQMNMSKLCKCSALPLFPGEKLLQAQGILRVVPFHTGFLPADLNFQYSARTLS